MGIYPPPLEKLIRQFSRLPGIGQKSATRVALHILRSDKELAQSLARSLMDVKEMIGFCSICCNLTDSDPCAVCRDQSRANGVICVVEGPGDQMALEESGTFRGRYHILHGTLSPLDGIGPEDLKIRELISRLDKEAVDEIILATNPTAEGEATSSFLAKSLSDRNLKITRIALGVPMGGNLGYMDAMTLRHALQNRNPVQS
ncbi:MAG: recombination mediator RecR [Desulfatiglandales bacterium]